MAAAIAAALVVALAVVACGSSDDSSSGGSDTSSSTSAAVKEASAQVERYKAVPKFVPPGPAFDAREVAEGKTLFILPSTSAVPYVGALTDSIKRIADQIGLKVVDWPNQGTPSEWAQGLDNALSRKVDAVELLASVNPGAVAPQLERLQQAGIPVDDSANSNVGDSPAPGLTSTTAYPLSDVGKLMADWIIADAGEEKTPNVLILTVEEILTSPPLMEGIEGEFDRLCSECKRKTLNFSLTNAATRIQPSVQSALTADPSIDYVLPLYDGFMVPFVQAAVQAVGAQDRIRAVSYDATPEILEDVAAGKVIHADPGNSADWTAYAIVDQNLRNMAGMKPLANVKLPTRLFDESNVAEAGDPPNWIDGYGDSYVTGYERLWKLKP